MDIFLKKKTKKEESNQKLWEKIGKHTLRENVTEIHIKVESFLIREKSKHFHFIFKWWRKEKENDKNGGQEIGKASFYT